MQFRRIRRLSLCLWVLLAGAVTLSFVRPQLLPAVSTAQSDGQTLVLDAGHGGMDGGAVAADGTTEQDINLSIAKSCQQLAGFLGTRAVLTRSDTHSLDYNPDATIRQNKVADIHARERIAAEQPHPTFVSIHLNKFSDTSYAGAQVFWSPNHAQSQVLAECIQQMLCDSLGQSRNAKRAADSIYLMKHLTCPAVIVECGFLSNVQDTELLKQKQYQKKLAMCIIGGVRNAWAQP